MPLTYALIHEENGAFGISFPDFPGAVSAGDTAEDAIRRGTAVLNFHVAGMVEDGEALPASRSLHELQADPEFAEDAAGAILASVEYDLPAADFWAMEAVIEDRADVEAVRLFNQRADVEAVRLFNQRVATGGGHRG